MIIGVIGSTSSVGGIRISILIGIIIIISISIVISIGTLFRWWLIESEYEAKELFNTGVETGVADAVKIGVAEKH